MPDLLPSAKAGARRSDRDRAYYWRRLNMDGYQVADTWTVAGRSFRSRLVVGTGKYKSLAACRSEVASDF